jgi:large subunit ribosomal protein L18
MLTQDKEVSRKRRRMRIRKKVSGTTDRPRLCVCKSLKHLYAQVVDDSIGKTLTTATTNTKSNKASGKHSFANIASAKALGRQIAEKAKASGVTQVVFDRSGYPYHGIIKAIAEAAREAGLKF